MSIPVAQLNLWLGVVCWVAALSAGTQDRVVVNSPAQAVPKSPGRQADAWRDAVLKGDAAKVKELLAARPELAIALDSFGKHWLHVAADAGHEEVVALLLEAKADCNAPGDRLNSIGSLETPLHIAARRGHPGIVRRLLEAGALVNSRASSGTTPLLLALTPRERHLGVEQLASASETNRTGRIATIRLLCQAGADPFAPERLFNRTNTPIQAASTPGHGMWLDLLLTNARPRTVRSPDGHSLLDIARQQERLEALAMLAFPDPAQAAVKGELNPLQVLVWQSPPGPRLADGTRLEPRHYWELLIAGQEPDLFTRIGLEDRAGVEAWIRDNPGQLALVRDAEGRTPLHWALAKGYVDLAVRLAELGADAETRDASGRSPLFYAIETGQLALLRQLPALVRRVQRDDTFPVSPLELALIKGHAEVGKFLLELNPDVGRPCLNGGTLLHLAVVKAPELVEALVTAGVPLDAVDRAGRLPLHEAARLGHVELLGRLLHPPALVHQPDKSGRTAFELAVLAGQLGAVDFFLKRKPDLARRDPAGASLLYLAVQSRQPDLVVRLLTAGADPALTDLAGRTPLHMAAGQGLDDILIKLLNANAPTNARDRDGRTAVELALVGGHASTARLLLQLEKWRPRP
ncbi:MAG: hypothetical protein EBS05_25115 [Proteobacteria bacterium]|nr:hypothetical protein [Pseudomonadota bacterium]